MLVNQSLGQHTLSLFSQRPKAQTADPSILQTLGASLRKEPASAFKPSATNDMSGFYANPADVSVSNSSQSGVTTRTLDAMASLKSNELKGAQENFSRVAAAQLDRPVSASERLSVDEWSSLSNELRHEGAKIKRLDTALEKALVDKKDVRVLSSNAYSDEEIISRTISGLVEHRVGTIQNIITQTSDPEFPGLVGPSNHSTGTLDPLDDAAVDSLRADLLAQTWDRYNNGDLKITIMDRTRFGAS